MIKVYYLIAAVLTSALLPTPSFALKLKIATLAPAGTIWMKEMKKGANKIKKQTSGRVKMKFYPGGVMGSNQSVLRKIRINQLQGGAFSASALSSIDDSIQSLSLPMLFRSFEEVDYVMGKVTDRITQSLSKNGYQLLGITEGGFARVMSTKPIHNMEDIRASKVWIPEGDDLVLETFKTMGISPIALPIADVFTGLQTGMIETIATPSTGAIAFQWHTKLAHMVDIPVTYVIGTLVISNKAFNKIKPEDQKIVKEEMKKVFTLLGKMNRKDNISATKVLKTQGISSVVPDPKEIQRWQNYSNQSIQTMISNNAIDKDIVIDIQNQLTKLRNQ